MKVSNVYSGDFISATEITKPVSLTIAGSHAQSFAAQNGNPAKTTIVLEFDETEKVLSLNKTNARFLASAISDDTDDWEGHKIILAPAQTQYMGKTVPTIEVRIPRATTPAPKTGKKNTMPVEESPADELSDPFAPEA